MDNCRLKHTSFSETTSLSSVTLCLQRKWNNLVGLRHVLPKLTSLDILDFDTLKVLSPRLNPIEFSDCKPWALKKRTLRGIRLDEFSYILHYSISSFMRHLILLLERAKNIEELWIEDSTRYNEHYFQRRYTGPTWDVVVCVYWRISYRSAFVQVYSYVLTRPCEVEHWV